MNEKELLLAIKTRCQTVLGKTLTGIYIHGSLAFGCFHWERSDIDFLVVVKEPMSQTEKEALLCELLILDENAPPKGLEMSVLLERDCRIFCYPTPFQFHFSRAHRVAARQTPSAFCRTMHGTDYDLAAHITVLRHTGIRLCGPDICNLFAPVPPADYVDSLLRDSMDAKTDGNENPVYYVLNLCRVLAYLENGYILSKSQGGLWGLTHLPAVFHSDIRAAWQDYEQGFPFSPTHNTFVCIEYLLSQVTQKSSAFLLP